MSGSRTDATLELAAISLQTSGPLFEAERLKNAGRLEEACATYAHLEGVLEHQLALTEQFNARFEPPHMDAASIAGTLANTLAMHGDLEATLGRRAEGNALRERAQVVAARYLPAADVAQRKRDLASTRAAQSRYHEAMNLLAEARDELEGRGDALGSAQVSAQLAETLEWLGDLRRAREEAGRASALIEPMVPATVPPMQDTLAALLGGDLVGAERRTRVLAVWSQLVQLDARVSRELGDLEHASALFEKVRSRVPSVAGPAIDFQLARIEIQAGRAAAGLAALDAMRPRFTGILRPKLGVLDAWRAQALLALRRPAEALAAAALAVDDLARHDDDDSLWRAQRTRASALIALDRLDDARMQLRDAVATITRLRRGSLGHRLDSTYLADKLPVVELALELAVTRGDATEACRLVELIKARGLTAILSLPRGELVADDALDGLSRELDQVEYQAYAQGMTAALRDRRMALLRRRAALIEQARIADPRWRSLSEPPPFDPAALSARLGKARAALSLYARGDQVIAILVDGDGCLAAMCQLDPRTIASLEQYRDSLAADRSPIDPAALDHLDLEDLVPDEVLDRALRSPVLAISPHGFLHLLPWPCLRCRGTRLFEHCPSTVVPNLSCLMLVPPHDGRSPAVGLIGAPDYPDRGPRRLVMASDELREIADTYGTARVLGGRVVAGAAATENAFRALATGPDAAGATLHVVCHGDFVAEEPLYSGLLLVDGKIDAAEIARLRIGYDEVVLSACSSGHRATAVDGIPLTGDDVVGLVGAFLEAGTRAVVVSITRARDDASYAFMTDYHARRAAGSPPVLALRETQQAMQKDRTYAPSLWAGFVVYGS